LGLASQAGQGLGRLGLDEADQANRFATDVFGTLTDAELEKFGLTSENIQSIIDAITKRRLGQLDFAGDIIDVST
jgi:Glu-tRNA(Gln) amidotransferase subunit E-like FAD-binding protein